MVVKWDVQKLNPLLYYRRNLVDCPVGVGDGLVHQRHAYSISEYTQTTFYATVIGSQGNFYVRCKGPTESIWVAKIFANYTVGWATDFNGEISDKNNIAVSSDESNVYVCGNGDPYLVLKYNAGTGAIIQQYKE